MPTKFFHALRPAHIAGQWQLNAEKEGEDDKVSAVYIPVSGIMLTKDEVNELTEDPTWWSRRFNESASKPPELLDDPKRFNPLISLTDKYEGGTVRIIHSLADEEITLTACRIRKLKLEPQFGGLTELRYTIMFVPTLDERFAKLMSQVDRDVQIEASAELEAKDRQKDLPLNQHGENETPEQTQASEEARQADYDRQLEEAAQGLEAQRDTEDEAA